MGTSSRWEVNSIDLSNVKPTIISHLVCWLKAIEKEISASHCLKLGMSELYYFTLLSTLLTTKLNVFSVCLTKTWF